MLGPTRFTVADEEDGQTLAALARRHALATTWNEARRLVDSGKLFVDGQRVTDPALRVPAAAVIELRPRAPRPVAEAPGRLVYDDRQLVVLDKPAGVSSVPYERREVGTALDLVRAHWKSLGRRASEQALHVVHRIDKDTSGLIVFAKTKLAERALAARFRTHDVERTYLCVVHGSLTDRRIESRLVADRGDGLRGSTRAPGQGKRAVSHVRVVESLPATAPVATLCEVRLETGKTHQIRIHLAENGHPIVGEEVYIRDFLAKGGTPLPSSRLLLHAATLGVVHPTTGKALRFVSEPPEEFRQAIERLRRRRR